MKLKDLEKRLKQEPNNLGLRVQVAGLMREAGRSLEAVELYRSVALAYRDQGRTQQAIAVCRSILDIAPEDAACQGLLAMLQQGSAPARPSRPLLGGAQTPARQTSPRAASPTREPGHARAPSPVATMRNTVPPAPVVPSLRAGTARPVSRPATNPPTVRPLTGPPPRPTTPASARAITRDRPPDPQDVLRSRPSEPSRRSSMDVTPLPEPVPYHLADRTSQPSRVSSGDIELPGADDTRVDEYPRGLLHPAPRLSEVLADTRGVPEEMDLAAELDTRQRPRIKSEELQKIAKPPPAVQVDRADPLDDLLTPPPRDSADVVTGRQPALEPPPRGSDDALTPPPHASRPALPRIRPSRTGSRPPVVSIPPKTSSQPPTVVSIPPPASRPSPAPKMPRIVRDSDDELTLPRDRLTDDDD